MKTNQLLFLFSMVLLVTSIALVNPTPDSFTLKVMAILIASAGFSLVEKLPRAAKTVTNIITVMMIGYAGFAVLLWLLVIVGETSINNYPGWLASRLAQILLIITAFLRVKGV